MALDDIAAHLLPAVERLVQHTREKLEWLGINTAGMFPQ
jgi:hypothetical protein